MATRYWVGGTGTWDASSTTNWSATTGGAGGASAPVAADTVIFDSLSGTGTCTTASGATCSIATLNSSTLGLTLGANLTMTGQFTLTLGTLSLGSSTLSCGLFQSNNANTRTLAFGTGKIIVIGNATAVINIGTITGFTATGNKQFDCTYSGSTGTRTITSSNSLSEANAFAVNIIAGSDIVSVTGAVTNIDLTGFAGTFSNAVRTIYGNLIISTGTTITAGTSATTFAATSGTQQITTNGVTLDFPITQNSPGATLQLQDNLTMGSTRTFTLTSGTLDLTGNSGNWTLSTGLWNSTNSNTRAINFGTGNITLTGNAGTLLSMSITTGLTITGTPVFNATYSGATGARAIGIALVTEATQPSINITAGSDTVNFSNSTFYKSLNFTGFSGTLGNNTRTVYGNLTISSGMTCTAGANGTTFGATSGTQQITTNGKTLDFPLIFNGVGGTFAFQDALTQGSTRAFTITNGTVQLKAGTTSTVGAFSTSGTTQKYLQSTTAGSQATLSQASGTVGVSYLTIQDINATGGATWNAYYENNNVDAGNNTNWNFGGTPSYDAEYGYKLRSFTEHGRF